MARGAGEIENSQPVKAVLLNETEGLAALPPSFPSKWGAGGTKFSEGNSHPEAPRGPESTRAGIVVVDDHPIYREGVRSLLERVANYRYCGGATSLELGCEIIRGENARLVILGLGALGDQTGETIRRLHRENPQLLILALVEKNGVSAGEAALKAGAHGLMMRDQGPHDLMEAIGAVLRGEMYMTNSLSSLMLKKAYFGDQKDGISGKLSHREMEIFGLLGMGHGTREIAIKLNLSRRTVNVHRENIKRKLGLKAASGLVYAAITWVGHRSAPAPERGTRATAAF